METMVVHVSFMIYGISLFVNDKGGENSVLHTYVCYGNGNRYMMDIDICVLWQ